MMPQSWARRLEVLISSGPSEKNRAKVRLTITITSGSTSCSTQLMLHVLLLIHFPGRDIHGDTAPEEGTETEISPHLAYMPA